MRISRQFQFFYENILSVQKRKSSQNQLTKQKQATKKQQRERFLTHKSFYEEENCLFCLSFKKLTLSWQPHSLYYWHVPLSTHLSKIYLHTLMFMTICRIFLHNHLSKSFLTCTHPFPLVFFICQNLFSLLHTLKVKTSKVLIFFLLKTLWHE